MLRERSLLYVAATRARDELVVSWNGKPLELLGTK
jgi:ATP-dependent exoDNAse (exonuclease V) alpha subunit